jgi:hypothetical protein
MLVREMRHYCRSIIFWVKSILIKYNKMKALKKFESDDEPENISDRSTVIESFEGNRQKFVRLGNNTFLGSKKIDEG